MTEVGVASVRSLTEQGDREDSESRQGPLRPVLWRLHFFSGFLAAPIVVWLCLSGILFACVAGQHDGTVSWPV
jgi:hypothetical protein